MYDDLSMEQLYSVIASQTVANLPDGWQEATAIAEIEEDDNGLVKAMYIDKGGQPQSARFQSAYRVYSAFDRIRDIVQEPDEPKWIKAVFTLQNSGQFTLNFSYPEPDNGSTEAS